MGDQKVLLYKGEVYRTGGGSSTDNKVLQQEDTSSISYFEILFAGSTGSTSNIEGSRKSARMSFKPSTGAIKLNGSAPDIVLDGNNTWDGSNTSLIYALAGKNEVLNITGNPSESIQARWPNITDLVFEWPIKTRFSNDNKTATVSLGISYLPLAGGTLTGDLLFAGANNRIFNIMSSSSGQNFDVGWNWNNGDGAGAFFRSSGFTDNEGFFGLYARSNNTGSKQLIGRPNGVLTWNGSFALDGNLNVKGYDVVLGTTGPSSNDSGDLMWTYGNGQEKMRIWTNNDYTAASGPNYRVYKADGTQLFSGTLSLSNHTHNNYVKSAYVSWGSSVSLTTTMGHFLVLTNVDWLFLVWFASTDQIHVMSIKDATSASGTGSCSLKNYTFTRSGQKLTVSRSGSYSISIWGV